MFSGKTQELIRQVHRAGFAGEKVQIFKPLIDNRWGKICSVRSHAGGECKAIAVKNAADVSRHIKKNTTLVAIDEVQFFKDSVIKLVQKLICRDIKVIVSGLPTDFRGEPFGPMPILLSKADFITHLTAICTYVNGDNRPCGRPATRTQRLINGQPAKYSDPIILIGEKDSYAARCPDHHVVLGKP